MALCKYASTNRHLYIIVTIIKIGNCFCPYHLVLIAAIGLLETVLCCRICYYVFLYSFT